MTYSISQANAELAAILHGTNLNKVQNLNGLHNRTARQLLADTDPMETIRKGLTVTPLFNQVWDYSYFGDTSTVTVHVRRLREKIEPDPMRPRYVKTVWGVGYKFER